MGSNDAKIIFARAGLGGLTAAGCLLLAAFDVEVYEQAPSSLRSSRAFSRAPMRPMSCTILAFETHCGTSPICRPSGSFDYLTTVRCFKLVIGRRSRGLPRRHLICRCIAPTFTEFCYSA